MSRAPSEPPKVSIAGFKVDRGAAQTAAGIGHTVAGCVPGAALGSGVDLASSIIDKGTIQQGIIDTWRDAIAQKIGVKAAQLQGEEGQALVADNIDLLPKGLQEEWHNAEDLATKTSKFAADFGVQAGLVAVMGGIPGMVASMALAKPETALLNGVLGIHEKLTVSMVTPQIMEMARQQIANDGNPNSTHTTIDKTLVGTYLITAYSERFLDEDGSPLNNEELVAMFQEHLQSKQENSHAITQLDDMIKRLDMDGAFASFVPPTADMTKLQGDNYLDIIANHIQNKQDLTNILFEPEAFAHKIEMHSRGMDYMQQAVAISMEEKAKLAAAPLRDQMAQANQFQGLPQRIPTSGNSKDPSNNFNTVA